MYPYNEDGYIIRISENAIIQIILSGLEAYSVSHTIKNTSKKKIETYGLLWGHQIKQNNNQIIYCIEQVSIDTSADRNKSSVSENENALELKRNIIDSFFPQYSFIGDFHTHPHNHYKEVEPEKLYCFSDTDFKLLEEYTEYWEKQSYRVGLVLTIARLERKQSIPSSYMTDLGTISFTLGNYRLWLKGYATYLDKNTLKYTKDNDENVILFCPVIEGLNYEYSDFGKVGKSGKFKATNN